jgi:hypothetical protein
VAGYSSPQATRRILRKDCIQAAEATCAGATDGTGRSDVAGLSADPARGDAADHACMAFVSAATRIAGLGDLPRCANPRQLMTYLGLVSSEQSSGANVTRDSITKASNSAACGLLIDAA